MSHFQNVITAIDYKFLRFPFYYNIQVTNNELWKTELRLLRTY